MKVQGTTDVKGITPPTWPSGQGRATEEEEERSSGQRRRDAEASLADQAVLESSDE
ncbi:hypothetical protein WKI68_14405 [Streptomyces sp. MS1.HAVA.3]|uniref:Uncharacterized protein n=1 Tax=Streptomyces caledonius TaxID=3134107 RepID=A0ABU8U391_9ACTN